MNDGDAPSARERLPAAPRMDPFTERRIRSRVLAGDRAAAGASRLSPKKLAFYAAAVVTSALGVAWMVVAMRSATWLDVRPSADAAIREHDEGGVHVVDLTDGDAEIRVRSHASGKHLVVRVPDGEIEDVGTRFVVAVAAGRTSRIDVLEGSVIFRRAGQVAIVVDPRSRYVREPDPGPLTAAALMAPSVGLPVLAAPSLPLATSAPPVEEARASASPVHEAASRSNEGGASHAATAAAPTASADAPTSGEDDAYLHVLTLLRAGDRPAARAAARTYVEHYPRGFRRAEMERVAASE